MDAPAMEPVDAARLMFMAILHQLEVARQNFADNPILLRLIDDQIRTVKDRLYELERNSMAEPFKESPQGASGT